MKLSVILSTVANAIANNAAIETYCQTNFGKSVAVFVHINPKAPPSISSTPAVGLTIQGYSRPTEANFHLVSFDLESAIYISDSRETTTLAGKVKTLKGFETLEDFSDLVFSVIEVAVSTSPTQLNTSQVSEQGTLLSISEYPGWAASRTWTVSTKAS